MSRLPLLCLLVALSGCGGASVQEDLSAAPPTSTAPAPSYAAGPLVGPFPKSTRTATPPPAGDATAASEPTTATHRPESTAVATAGTATSGPGRLASPPRTPSPRPTPTAVGGTVTVTDDDNDANIRLRIGQRLRVRLSQGTWDPPVSSADGVVVRRSSSGGYPTDQPVDATFEAVGAGGADVTATSDAACFHTEPRCLMAQRNWQVHVLVR